MRNRTFTRGVLKLAPHRRKQVAKKTELLTPAESLLFDIAVNDEARAVRDARAVAIGRMATVVQSHGYDPNAMKFSFDRNGKGEAVLIIEDGKPEEPTGGKVIGSIDATEGEPSPLSSL